jgi:hypothetical protein
MPLLVLPVLHYSSRQALQAPVRSVFIIYYERIYSYEFNTFRYIYKEKTDQSQSITTSQDVPP